MDLIDRGGGTRYFPEMKIPTFSSLPVFLTFCFTASLSHGAPAVENGLLIANDTEKSAANIVNLVVGRGFTVSASGLTATSIINGGIVSPGGKNPRTLEIVGIFVQREGGTLQMNLGTPDSSDFLKVRETASLAGTLKIESEVDLKLGDQFKMITAKGGFVGNFDTILFNVAARGRFIITGDSGVLRIVPRTYSQMATIANERALAGVLDTWIDDTSGDTLTVSENLDLLTADGYRAAFSMISPALYGAGVATAIEQSQSQSTVLNQHLNSRRLRPSVANDAGKPWEAWALSSGLYSPGSMSSLAGDDFSSGNFMSGIERQIGEDFTAGLFTGYGDSEGNFAGSSETEQERFTIGAHATAQRDGYYANSALGFGVLEMDVKRSIRFSGLSREARSSTDGTEFFGLVSGGYDFRQAGWVFGPTASLQYSKVRYDDVKENGAGVLDLAIANPEDDSLRSQIGGRVAYLHKANDRLTLIPEARVFWQHEFLRDNETLDAALEQGAGLGFAHQVADSDGDSVFTGVGLGFQTDFGFYGNVSYDIEICRESDVNQTLSVSADWKF